MTMILLPCWGLGFAWLCAQPSRLATWNGYALPRADVRTAELAKRFNATSDKLVIVGHKGHVVTVDGLNRLRSDPDGATFPWHRDTLDRSMQGFRLLRHDAPPVSWDAIRKANTAVAVFFGGGWCPPCKAYRPKLVETYNNLKRAGKPFEVIYVSSDHSEDDFRRYWGSMPWPALPFNSPMKKVLGDLYPYSGIPTVYIIDPKTGRVITPLGRAATVNDPFGEDFPWYDEACKRLPDDPSELSENACVIMFTNEAVDDDGASDECVQTLFSAAESVLRPDASSDVESDSDDDDDPEIGDSRAAGMKFFFTDVADESGKSLQQFLRLGPITTPVVVILESQKRHMYRLATNGLPNAGDILHFVDGFVTRRLTPVVLE